MREKNISTTTLEKKVPYRTKEGFVVFKKVSYSVRNLKVVSYIPRSRFTHSVYDRLRSYISVTVYGAIRSYTEENEDCIRPPCAKTVNDRFSSVYRRMSPYTTRRYTIVIWSHVNRRISPYTVVDDGACSTWVARNLKRVLIFATNSEPFTGFVENLRNFLKKFPTRWQTFWTCLGFLLNLFQGFELVAKMFRYGTFYFSVHEIWG
jgi:hypothetical protein